MEGTALLLTDDRSSLSPSSPGQDRALKMYLVPYIEADKPRNVAQLSMQPLRTWPAAPRFIRALILTDLTANK